MMGSLKQAGAIIAKDLLVELRTRQTVLSMILFSVLTVLVLAFAFEPTAEETERIAPGLLWVAFLFAGTIGLEHVFAFEREMGGMEGLLLSPVDRGALYIAKVISCTIFMTIAELATLPFFVVFFNLDIALFPGKLLLLNLAGTIGFCSVGTLLAAVTAHTRMKGVILPILLFPLVVPVLVTAVGGADGILRGESVGGPFGILIAFDAIFVTAGFLTFGYVVEEGE